jgi:hypothetical protein
MMMKNYNPIILGISGKIGSGKDCLAELITKNANKVYAEEIMGLPSILSYALQKIKPIRVHKKSFAYKLKQTVSLVSGHPMRLVKPNVFANKVYDYNQDDKNLMVESFGLTIGQMLQIVGTDCMRNHLHTNTWINALFSDVDKMKNNDIWLITDVRFKNEAKAIKDNNGLLIRINGDPLDIRKNSTRDLKHQSETDLDKYTGFDMIIDNNGTLKDLEEIVHDDILVEMLRTL